MINLIHKLISKYNYDKIFLITEEKEYLNIMKNEFSNKLIYLKILIGHIKMMHLKYILEKIIDINSLKIHWLKH